MLDASSYALCAFSAAAFLASAVLNSAKVLLLTVFLEATDKRLRWNLANLLHVLSLAASLVLGTQGLLFRVELEDFVRMTSKRLCKL